jgi:hypothetical protein
MASYVTHKGIDQVLGLYELRETPFYAVYLGKDLQFTHTADDFEEGKQFLQKQLAVPLANGCTAIFTIKFYEQLDDKGRLDKNSELGVTNFRVLDPNQYQGAVNGISQDGYPVRNADLLAEIRDLKEQLAEQEIAEQPGILGGFLSNPEVQTKIVHVLGSIVGNFISKMMPVEPSPTIGSIDDQEQKISQALQVLRAADPLLGDHLLKLAGIAQNNPGQFKMLLGML